MRWRTTGAHGLRRRGAATERDPAGYNAAVRNSDYLFLGLSALCVVAGIIFAIHL